jgi:hypothetical protein
VVALFFDGEAEMQTINAMVPKPNDLRDLTSVLNSDETLEPISSTWTLLFQMETSSGVHKGTSLNPDRAEWDTYPALRWANVHSVILRIPEDTDDYLHRLQFG